MRIPGARRWTCAVLPFMATFSLAAETNRPERTDYYLSTYKDYEIPAFLPFRKGAELMKLSSEKTFYTLSLVEESSRANALIEAARKFEGQALYRKAVDAYNRVVDDYPDSLYRVSRYGVFVPASAYTQLRILNLPPETLKLYRTKYDAAAAEAFDQATRKYSLELLAELRHTRLATSYGGPTLVKLGDAALDRGNYLEALEAYLVVQEWFPDEALLTPELLLKAEMCRRKLGMEVSQHAAGRGKTALAAKDLAVFRTLAGSSQADPSAGLPRRVSATYESTEDHVPMLPAVDPHGKQKPVWSCPLSAAGEQRRYIPHAFSHAVATKRSVIYRHKNIVFCRSILTGELRWVCDIGGRVTWQSIHARQYPHENLIVQDGLVFTTIYRTGPSLVAIDEVTGQIRWSYGPISPSTEEEARMKFRAAPAGGPGTVYAGYVLDNIEGNTHVDSEYGILAFESQTGRVKWRRAISALRPGKFAAGAAVSYRNRIRSFSSPPLYHENTVYYCNNAGVVTALDATSGRVRWLMKYPYHASLHDMTKGFGGVSYHRANLNPYGPHHPMFWFHQRPFMIKDELYVLPVDSPLMLCLDRRTGKVKWTRNKDKLDRWDGPFAVSVEHNTGGYRYVLGPTSEGHILIALSDGNIKVLDRMTGKQVWNAHVIKKQTNAALVNKTWGIQYALNHRNFYLGAPPTLAHGDRLYTSYFAQSGPYDYGYTVAYALNETSIGDRKALVRHMYIHPDVLGDAARVILDAPNVLKKRREGVDLKRLSGNDLKNEKRNRVLLGQVAEAEFPENDHRPFRPFARLTFKRLGVPFEFRIGARDVAMVYDRARLDRLAGQGDDPDSLFVRGELRMAENRLREAAEVLEKAMAQAGGDDLALRARIGQQMYTVYKRLARSSVRSGEPARELEYCAGMGRSITTIANEIETLLAYAEAYERNGTPRAAAVCLRKVIEAYRDREYPLSTLAAAPPSDSRNVALHVLDNMRHYANPTLHARAIGHTMRTLSSGLGLYFSALSPLPPDITLHAGEIATRRLIDLQKEHPDVAAESERTAGAALANTDAAAQVDLLGLYPDTPAGRRVLAARMQAVRKELAGAADVAGQASLRRTLWQLSDLAETCRFDVPAGLGKHVFAPSNAPAWRAVPGSMTERECSLEGEEQVRWLILPRKDDGRTHPDWLLLTSTVKKHIGYKSTLHAVDLADAKTVWKAREKRLTDWREEIRLANAGAFEGLHEGCIVGDTVIAHGLYDVLAFRLADGHLKWRYRVPFDFRIEHSLLSGDLLILAGEPETIALYVLTDDPNGEVAWQQKETGALYAPPYLHGNRLLSVRKLPFNVTARYRATGRLLGRLELPTLTDQRQHPLLDEGPRAVPIAHDRNLLVLSNSDYYLMLDTTAMRTLWKRAIDENDATLQPPLRFALKGDYLAVLKRDYDRKALYMLSSRTGNVLWKTNPKRGNRPPPFYSMHLTGPVQAAAGEGKPRPARLYGIMPHPGQAFYFVCLDARTGEWVFKPREEKGYADEPKVILLPPPAGGDTFVARVKDRQDFELRALDMKTGQRIHSLKVKGSGAFGVAGRASATVQNGHLALYGGKVVRIAGR